MWFWAGVLGDLSAIKAIIISNSTSMGAFSHVAITVQRPLIHPYSPLSVVLIYSTEKAAKGFEPLPNYILMAKLSHINLYITDLFTHVHTDHTSTNLSHTFVIKFKKGNLIQKFWHYHYTTYPGNGDILKGYNVYFSSEFFYLASLF